MLNKTHDDIKFTFLNYPNPHGGPTVISLNTDDTEAATNLLHMLQRDPELIGKTIDMYFYASTALYGCFDSFEMYASGWSEFFLMSTLHFSLNTTNN